MRHERDVLPTRYQSFAESKKFIRLGSTPETIRPIRQRFCADVNRLDMCKARFQEREQILG
jgi:hypothetical protein